MPDNVPRCELHHLCLSQDGKSHMSGMRLDKYVGPCTLATPPSVPTVTNEDCGHPLAWGIILASPSLLCNAKKGHTGDHSYTSVSQVGGAQGSTDAKETGLEPRGASEHSPVESCLRQLASLWQEAGGVMKNCGHTLEDELDIHFGATPAAPEEPRT